jgi:hypothetical protein
MTPKFKYPKNFENIFNNFELIHQFAKVSKIFEKIFKNMDYATIFQNVKYKF